MTPLQSNQFSSFVKGVNASASRTNQPQNSVPRISNLLFTKRGSLVTCDGSQIIHALNGVPTANRGKVMAGFLFAPTGVSRYYLTVQKALDIPLGAPQNLTLATAAGGTLAAATYFYKVTAIDGAGGETLASPEASIATGASGKNTLTWNIVPNAQGYNVYRGTVTNAEGQLASATGAILPVPQPVVGALTVSFIDLGNPLISASPIPVLTLTSTRSGLSYNLAVVTSLPHNLYVGIGAVSFAATSNPVYNTGGFTVIGVIDNFNFIVRHIGAPSGPSTGGTVIPPLVPPPLTDTTQQTSLIRMPTIVGSPATLPIPYTNSNIVALYPADLLPSPDGGGGGGTGGGGTPGGGGTGGGSTGGGATASGGVAGNVSFIPDILQFSNRAIIALGNGFPGQVYSDPTTGTNPATVSNITSITTDAFGVVTVTVTGGHGVSAAAVGGNIIIAGLSGGLAAYNGTFPTIQIVSAVTLKVRNLAAIGLGAGATGTVTTTSLPVVSTFTQAFPVWATGVTYLAGDIITPTPTNNHYYRCTQGGISAAAQPTFPTVTGAQVQEASPSKVIWQEAGLTSSTSPPPPGFGHIRVFAGSLWAWNTSPTNTANGLDGPTCLRMSDSNNPNSWNPVNQAFLDKDDGTEGYGLYAFTIAGFGIPPEGSLVAFKQFAGYQIVGVFGSPSFLIQRIKSSLGCTAPRTIQFATGFGLIRFTHLGYAVFDGINDRIVDEDIHPYIFPTQIADNTNITTVDYTWVSVSWATQTAYPAMYVAAVPIGNSNGALTRMFCYDLVLKAWSVIDLPFAISCLFQAFSNVAVPVTVLGTFNDGCLHRWQSGDSTWDNSIDTPGPSLVNWNVQTPIVFNKGSFGGRLYVRQIVVRGRLSMPTALFNPITVNMQGEPVSQRDGSQFNLGTDGTIQINTPINEKVTDIYATISGVGEVEIDSFDIQSKEESPLVPAVLT